MSKFLELTPTNNVSSKELIAVDKIVRIKFPKKGNEFEFVKFILTNDFIRVTENEETILKMLTYFGYKIISVKDMERMGG